MYKSSIFALLKYNSLFTEITRELADCTGGLYNMQMKSMIFKLSTS